MTFPKAKVLVVVAPPRTPSRVRHVAGTLLVLAVGVLALGKSATASPAPRVQHAGTATATPAALSEQAFAFALLRVLGSGSGPNVVVAPQSLATGLAMLELGASGSTESGIAHALQAARTTPSAFGAGLGVLLRALGASPAVVFNESDALFANTGFSPRPGYLRTLRQDFGAELRTVPFAHDPAAAVRVINADVAAKTDGLIPTLFTAPLDPTTLLVLVDAVYLTARWESPFPEAATGPASFHLASGATVDVPFMRAAEDVPVSVSNGLSAVDLAYEGGRFGALILEPTASSLASFIAQLTPARLTAVLGRLRRQSVEVVLPKLDLSTAAALNAPLAALGMQQAFTATADLSGITGSPRLHVSVVRQVATLKVDEAGTTAAAATGVGLAPTAVLSPQQTLQIDRPFLLLVRDEQTGAVLFGAVVTDPATK